MDILAIGTVISGLIVAITGAYQAFNLRKLRNAETDKMITSAFSEAVPKLWDRLDKVEGEVRRLHEENVELKNGINILVAQIKAQGLTPFWQPRD